MPNEHDPDRTPSTGTSIIGVTLECLSRRFAELAGDISEAAQRAPEVEGSDLEDLLFELEEASRKVGDYAHDAARKLNTVRNERRMR